MNPTTNDPNNPSNTGPRYNRGIIGLLGGQPNNTLLSSLYGAWQHHKQNQMDQQLQNGMEKTPGTEDQMPIDHNAALSPATQDQPSPSSMMDSLDLASDAFSGGKMVTSPTVALIGEKGPEAVVPMGPSDKVSGAMLQDQPIAAPHNLGGTARARFSHPHGPVSSARYKPITSELPLKPNSALR